jgi:5-methylcytosine-specific restriction enzyme subunit McrC
MLEYAYNLRSLRFFDNTIELNTIDDIFESIASVLAKKVLDRNRKGLYRDYVNVEEPLPYLKGRLLTAKTINKMSNGSIKLECSYDENTADVIDNQILLWTLYHVPRLNIRRENVRRDLRRAYRAVSSSVNLKQINPDECVGRFYHRLNDDYRPMHGLCKFFLENSGPINESGEHEMLPFVLHMPNLFEKFVAQWLSQRLLLDKRFYLKAQEVYNLNPDHTLSFRIDLVIIDKINKNVVAVLDTKYKKDKLPAVDDVNQIVAYAISMKTDKGILIYPSMDTHEDQFTCGDIKCYNLVFDISKDPEESGGKFIEKLMGII